MCGIVGVSWSHRAEEHRPEIGSMADSLRHRGPDDQGTWADDDRRVELGFRRLAIRDLDPRANQPMVSASGRTLVAFNGEIYNTDDIARRFCSGTRWRTTGDTEVLLEAFERGGEAVIDAINGMFAIALVDRQAGAITLARDPLGQKPLYLYQGDGFLAFASELRSFAPFGLELDPTRVPEFLHFGYVPAPATFYRRTTQVLPGEIVRIDDGRIVSRRRYFDPCRLDWGRRPDIDIEALDRLLADAVSIRTQSDVPLGVFLSGGIDSSLICAELASAGRSDLPTFTVGFDQAKFDEQPHAAAIAAELGLPHTPLRIEPRSLPELVEQFLDCYEQPYADTSGLATMLLCREVSRHVTVALSGDGGDEFFGGYARYRWFRQALAAGRLPGTARRLVGRLAARLDRRRGHRIERLLGDRDAAGLYAEIIRGWHVTELSELLPDHRDADRVAENRVRAVFESVAADPLSQAACFDAVHYIPDDLQVKLDRASMRVGLEVRCPLLDRRVVAAGAGLSTRRKLSGGLKSVLRRVLARHLPRSLFERPKMGFGVPLADWLAGPLAELVTGTLDARATRECGWLNPATVAMIRRRFAAGRREYAGAVWKLFVLARAIPTSSVEASKRAA